MNHLLNMLKDKIAKGEDKPCITGTILKDPEAKLDAGRSCQKNFRSSTLINTSCQRKSIPSA